ncbi:hypothetical protein AAFF_G00260230 [Aldrovandia affinis]|uniref:Homocysteine-responsive endoplasmic reticulum-resident ubiquitin-like domain member 2 protein n=1 Tax=Aldrovandia affinis TaxID=143900 RepID=A0AAD7RCJ8_9TELE|nr:hypothetical protein AAFF_G00260230 [Aldrovandia affinis]
MFSYAWTDFHRFLLGWMPGHHKVNKYSRRLARELIVGFHVVESSSDVVSGTSPDSILYHNKRGVLSWPATARSNNGNQTKVHNLTDNSSFSRGSSCDPCGFLCSLTNERTLFSKEKPNQLPLIGPGLVLDKTDIGEDAVDIPVTLVIKAPNQKYDDQTISCFLNWTVEKLKSHLSNVYPSKPLSKDQRLVYSGKLLLDHLQLREVLRKQDEYHMVHLVCASRSPPGSPCPPSDTRTHATSDPGPSSSVSSGSSAPPTPEIPPTSSVGSSDGLRHRGGHAPNPASPNFTQGAQFLQQGAIPGYPNPMQVLWWQQAYARHYYMQYQAAVASSQTPSPALTPAPFPPLSSPSNQLPAQPNDPPPVGPNPAPGPGPAPAPAPAPEERPANPNIQMNAQGGALLNEDELNRDWLDWMYTVSRAAILLSIVYFYSSFSRFVMVIGAMLLVYLHQVGWFPFRPDLQNPGAPEEDQDDREADRHDDIQEMERVVDEVPEEEEGESGEEGPADPTDGGPQYHGFLASIWSFITTFFTSLIPEGPPQPAN